MKAPESHQPFLGRQNYAIKVFANEIFSEYEMEILRRYGYWLEALADGTIPPVTPLQEQFVRVSTNQAKPSTIFEEAWWKLMQRRKFEAMPTCDPRYIAGSVGETTFGHSGDWWSGER